MARRPSYSSTFLLDEGICGPDIIAPLRTVPGWTIERHHDYLERGVPDVAVIKFCAEKQWALLTGDDDMRFSDDAKAAMTRHAVPVFMVVLKKQANATQIYSALVAAQERILNTIRKTKVGFCAHVLLGWNVRVMRYFDPVPLEHVSDSQRRTIRRYGLDALGKQRDVG